MIAVPRLYTLVLGEVEIAETILSPKIAGSVVQVADGLKNEALLAVLPEGVGTMLGKVTAHMLSKLVPPT
jgi:hypothetical protein